MKAVRINEWATPVEIENIPKPSPGSDQVLVSVQAIGVNPIDSAVAAGYMTAYFSIPMTLGRDFAGDVVAVGENIKHVKRGDRVYGLVMNGAWAEFVLADANAVAQMPQSVNYVQAAAVPLSGLSAWQTLVNSAQVKPGERVLIHGAAGGIGSFAVQIAKHLGVTVIAHDKGKADYLQQLGADQIIDSSSPFEDEAGDVDVVLDLVGGDLMPRSLAFLKSGARYVISAALVQGDEGAARGIKVMGVYTQPTIEELNKLAELIDSGVIKVHLDKTFPFEEVGQAMAFERQPGSQGKVVLTLA